MKLSLNRAYPNLIRLSCTYGFRPQTGYHAHPYIIYIYLLPFSFFQSSAYFLSSFHSFLFIGWRRMHERIKLWIFLMWVEMMRIMVPYTLYIFRTYFHLFILFQDMWNLINTPKLILRETNLGGGICQDTLLMKSWMWIESMFPKLS